MIAFTSDLHFGHKNIVRGVSNWEDKSGCRDFKTVSEMNQALVDGILKVYSMSPDWLTLYFLGDWSFGGFDNVAKLRNRLPENMTIHFIGGNHDQHIRNDRDCCQDLFDSYSEMKSVFIDGDYFVMCHYPMRVWEGSHKGAYQLHGHCIPAHAEILTNNGWKDIDSIDYTDLVYSRHNGQLELQPIDQILKLNYTGQVYRGHSKSYHFDFTDQHKCIHLTNTGNLIFENASDFFNRHTVRVICSGKIESSGIGWTKEMLQLYICLAADGSLTNNNLGRLRASKPRKIKFFKEVLSALKIEYSDNLQKDGSTYLNFQLPEAFKGLAIKGLDPILLQASFEEVETILETYSYTDGYRNGNAVHIYSSKKKEIDLLQHLFVTKGYKAVYSTRDNHGFSRVTSYELRVSMREHTRVTEINKRVKPQTVKNEKYWCIQTKYKNFFMRLNGTVQLTGNCHDTLWRQNIYGKNDHSAPMAKQLDVGVDSAFKLLGEYRPFTLEEVRKFASGSNLLVDHHNEQTNMR